MRWKPSVAVVALGLALVAAACGGDNSGAVATTDLGRRGHDRWSPPPRRPPAAPPRRTGAAATTATAAGDPRRRHHHQRAGGASGKTSITIGETLAPASLDITQQSGAAVPQALLYNVYETLVKIDDTGAYQPLLAADYKASTDGLTYTFTLQRRPHVRRRHADHLRHREEDVRLQQGQRQGAGA